MISEKRKLWNAFPLASLSVRGISACAADVLRYLAVRSDWLGSTIVGQRRIADDMHRSKDYVTRGLKELEEKKLITTMGRKRSERQADRHTISKSILAQKYQDLIPRNNPGQQDDADSNDPDCDSDNPDRQDFDNPDFGSNNPDQQDETLQSKPSSKSINLTDIQPKDQNLVNKEVNKQVPSPSAPDDECVDGNLVALADMCGHEATGLVTKLHPLCNLSLMQKELPFAKRVIEFMPENMDVRDVLEYNHAHKKGGLVIRSWEQFWLKVLKEGENVYLINEYATHEAEQCKECKARSLVSWQKKQRQQEARDQEQAASSTGSCFEAEEL